jgi:hypothetical protein
MPKLFVSYAHEDEKFVDKIVNHLDYNTNLKVVIDRRCLSTGDSLTKIFGEIADSDFLMPILSRHYVISNWCQKELRVALVKSIQEKNFKLVPIVAPRENWHALSKEMPSDLETGLIDITVGRFDKEKYADAFQKLVESLSPNDDPEKIYSRVVGPENDNPFRRVRAEHFIDQQVFANLFAEPERDYDSLVSPKPTLLEGCRGSGKTMILKSLEASITPLIRHCSSFEDSNCNFFGVYFRATQDTFAVLPEGLDLDPKSVQFIFYDELVLRLAQSLLDELMSCIKNGLLSLSSQQERTLCAEIMDSLRIEGNVSELPVLKKKLSESVSLIIDYVRAKSRGDSVTYQVKTLSKDNLITLCEKVRTVIPELNKCCIYFLVDEYENFKDFQKVVLNTLVKWHDARYFSFKVAYKNTAFSSSSTLEEQPLEEGPDYTLINLDFDIRNDRARFERHIKNICSKIMKEEGFSSDRITDILQTKSQFVEKNHVTPDGLTSAQIEMEVSRMASERGLKWDKLGEKKQKQLLSHFSVAAEYRLLGPRRRSVGGFKNCVLLSSGIVRNFLELCGMSYYFARRDGVKVKKGEKILVKHQTEAAYTLSEYHLWVIGKNVTYLGPTLFNFIVDIGEILHQKLMKHLSEPEAIILSIRNPQMLKQIHVKVVEEKDERIFTLKEILQKAILHSILLEYKEKQDRRLKQRFSLSYGLILNRIYAPALRISPRSRWIKILSPKDIEDLINSSTRQQTRRRLIEKAVNEVTSKQTHSLEKWSD